MTLVVAQKTKSGIKSISDTMLTDQNNGKLNPYFEGALKSHILNENISFHFANLSSTAEDVLKAINEKFHDLNDINYNEMIRIIKKIMDSNINYSDSDFILIDISTNCITKITKDEIFYSVDKAYIGDLKAYSYYIEKYNSYFKKYENDKENEYPQFNEITAMSQAFENVIEADKIVSVGGLIVEIIEDNGSLMYPPKISASAGPQEQLKMGDRVKFGERHNGGYVESSVSNEKNGAYQIFGFLLNPGDIAILWNVGISIYPNIIKSYSSKQRKLMAHFIDSPE